MYIKVNLSSYHTANVSNVTYVMTFPMLPMLPMIQCYNVLSYHTANVTALAGETTSLNCRVHRLGNRFVSKIYVFQHVSCSRSVSWLKRDQIHLLTVGRYTYTSDLRSIHLSGFLGRIRLHLCVVLC